MQQHYKCICVYMYTYMCIVDLKLITRFFSVLWSDGIGVHSIWDCVDHSVGMSLERSA